MLTSRLQALRASSFARSTGVLVSGTVAAHALTVVAMLVITRLFTPEDFSVLAVFSGLLVVVGTVAGLRLDVVVPLPESDADAVNVLACALAAAVGTSLLLVVPLVLAPGRIAELLGQPALAPHLWLVPLGVLLFAWQSALQLWTIRRKAFGTIAASRVGQAAVASGTQISLGWAGAGPIGLLLGQIANHATTVASLGARLLRRDESLLREISLARMREQLRRYQRYPKLSTIEALCNGAALHLPIILMSALVQGPVAGYVNLAMYAMQAPMALIGTAVAQVFLSRASEEHRAGRIGPFTTRVLGSLLKTGVGPLLFAGIVAPVLFAPVFGAQWQRSGDLVAWMTPWFIVQFLAAPVSMVLYVTDRPLTALVLQVIGMLMRIGVVVAGALLVPDRVAEVYSVSGFIYYGAFLLVVLHAVGARAGEVGREVRSALGLLAAWGAGGIAVAITAPKLLEWLR